MNVVDSSGWIEFLIAGHNGPAFRAVIDSSDVLIVPTLAIFEVYRWMARELGEPQADLAAAMMRNAVVADLDSELAIVAAQLAAEHRLAMADGIILATARRHGATLWTQDADFEGIAGIRYLPRA